MGCTTPASAAAAMSLAEKHLCALAMDAKAEASRDKIYLIIFIYIRLNHQHIVNLGNLCQKKRLQPGLARL